MAERYRTLADLAAIERLGIDYSICSTSAFGIAQQKAGSLFSTLIGPHRNRASSPYQCSFAPSHQRMCYVIRDLLVMRILFIPDFRNDRR